MKRRWIPTPGLRCSTNLPMRYRGMWLHNATAMTASRTIPEYLGCYTEYWSSRAFIWNGDAELPVDTVMVRETSISRNE
jgi:hypothetical protein